MKMKKRIAASVIALSLLAPSTALGAYQAEVTYGVNFRWAPSTDGGIHRMLNKGEPVQVIEQVNNYWLKVKTQEGMVGYISADDKYTKYVSSAVTSPASSGTITSSVNFRSAPRVANNQIGLIRKGTVVQVLEVTNSYWVKINHNGTVGYISSNYISHSGAPSQPSTGSGSTSSAKADAIIATAQSLSGKVTYSYGVRNPSRWIFDCSSFTQYVYGQHGVSMKWGTRYQQHEGSAVSKSNLKRGDLVFFDTNSNGSINHVGIYMGGGQFIHNKPSSNGVAIDTLNSGYWQDKYVKARRVL
ncbi:C40 family peptidase [Xylanibacillus composti]|uniref:Uncharacterized protein n=1 Tax=Xylanibacillus composti TaxID=1572762 RepID=A0A8J4H7B2_9BACL|nr:SH3 domain-containing C40 family peptidase [Xylanibacillus composti]GIQ71082.1 hypothetical protein XYCOK13_39060 [Xylanibacillus composti]